MSFVVNEPKRTAAPEHGHSDRQATNDVARAQDGESRTRWEVPKPKSVYEVCLDADTVTFVRRHGNPDGIRVVMCHGNGLAVDLYYPFWSLLTDEFDVFVYDLRNHGWNSVGPRALHNIPTLARDQNLVLREIDRHFGSKPTVGLYHSLSAFLALVPALHGHSELAARVLFDPPIYKPGANDIEFDYLLERQAVAVRRRPRRFKTRGAYLDYIRRSPLYSEVVPGVVELMAQANLRYCDDRDDYELRCPPKYEAQIFEFIRAFSPLVDYATGGCPTKVIGADPTMPFAYLPTIDLGEITAVEYDFLPDTTHFLPLEEPRECASLTRQFLQACLQRCP